MSTIVDWQAHRGYRNNNPFNLEGKGIPWKGIVGADGVYLMFDTALDGLRAGFLNLRNQQKLHSLRTVSDIIAKFAPSNDGNDVVAYCVIVCAHLSAALDRPVLKGDQIDMSDTITLRAFGEACITQEIGGVPYGNAIILQAVAEALTA